MDGRRGVEPKPNRTGGCTSAMAPRSVPCQLAVTDTTGCRSQAPYHSRRPDPALPRVRTPGSTIRVSGSITVAQAGAVANRRGTARRTNPSQPRAPMLRWLRNGPATTCSRPGQRATSTAVTSTVSKRYVLAMNPATSSFGAISSLVPSGVSTMTSLIGPNGDTGHRPTTMRWPAAVPKAAISPSNRQRDPVPDHRRGKGATKTMIPGFDVPLGPNRGTQRKEIG